MTDLTDKQEAGVQFIGGIMGEKFSDAFRDSATSDRFGSQITRMAAESCFVDAWQQPGLARRDKSLVIIAMLIAVRQPAELKNHVKIGLANGLTVKELEGILVQMTPYVGFPCIATATSAVIEAMREAGVSPEGIKTSEERGLL